MTNNKTRHLRTINDIVKDIKQLDPDTAVTKYLIDAIIKEGDVYVIMTGNKRLIDEDDVFRRLGLIEVDDETN